MENEREDRRRERNTGCRGSKMECKKSEKEMKGLLYKELKEHACWRCQMFKMSYHEPQGIRRCDGWSKRRNHRHMEKGKEWADSESAFCGFPRTLVKPQGTIVDAELNWLKFGSRVNVSPN